jgi:hypothetical protein
MSTLTDDDDNDDDDNDDDDDRNKSNRAHTGQNWLRAIQESTAVCLDATTSSSSSSLTKANQERALHIELIILNHSLEYQQKLCQLLLSSEKTKEDNIKNNKNRSTTTKKKKKEEEDEKKNKNKNDKDGKDMVEEVATSKNKTDDPLTNFSSTVDYGGNELMTDDRSSLWESVPRMNPPKFQPFKLPDDEHPVGNGTMDKKHKKNKKDGGGYRNDVTSNNQYASIMDDDDDDDDDAIEFQEVAGDEVHEHSTASDETLSHCNRTSATPVADARNVFGGYGYDEEAGDWPVQPYDR